jgi:hypothetical protein
MVNDKIYQLARQAELIEFESIPGSTAVTPSYESIVKARKFAELIVKECLDITDAHTEVFQTDRDKALIEHIKQSVKQHFGVE